MKKILCYGDSNTYGYIPKIGGRYPENIRWTGILSALLEGRAEILEEGCNSRTVHNCQPKLPWKNGLSRIRPTLNYRKPIDIVIIMLGTNDLKTAFNFTINDIASTMKDIIKVVYEFGDTKQDFRPEVILVSPPHIGKGIRPDDVTNNEFDESAHIQSLRFAKAYKSVADNMNCKYIDAAFYVNPSSEDSLHLDPENHKNLAEGLFKYLTDENML